MGFVSLKQKHKSMQEQLCESHNIRIHRALKWLERAEQETDDDDAQFIFLWIAFNAAYADEFGNENAERINLNNFFATLTKADKKDRIYQLLFQSFTGEIRTLIENKFVFQPFWKALREHDSSESWKTRFEASKKAAMAKLLEHDTAAVLSIIFDRLYILRNQLIHGGATWNSSVNRNQVSDGTKIMAKLVPLMIDIMIDSPDQDFGALIYPVIPSQ